MIKHEMTHDNIVKIAGKWLKKHDQNGKLYNCAVVTTELKCLNKTGEIPDVIGINSSTSFLIEVKTSYSDFINDFKKPFRQKPELGMGEFRYYLCPINLIKENELPEKWGLLYINPDGVIDIIKYSDKFEYNIGSERNLLYSLLIREKKK